jgi:opacity protein-like surface antigen
MHLRKDQPARIRFLVCLLGALAFWSWTAPAAAELHPGDTELFVSNGGQHDGAQISIFGIELIPRPGRLEGTGAVFGLTLDHQMTHHWGVELDGGYTPRLGEPYEAAVTTATAGLIYHVNPTDKGVLYLTAGGGAAWFLAADRGIDNDVTGTGMAAIGAKIDLSSRILIRLDFRYFYVPSPFADQNMLQRTTIGVGFEF